MVSILPSARTPWDVLGAQTGQALQSVLPGAVNQGFQRQQGLNAIDQLQQALGAAGGGINKMLPALARAYTLNPNLERSGLGQQYLQQAKVGNAYGNAPQMADQATLTAMPPGRPNQPNQGQAQQQTQQSSFATPSPFNIMTKDEMDEESKRFAQKLGDPNAYNTRFNQLQAQNDAATSQRQALEEAALNANVNPADLPRFMVVNSHLDPRNPSEWAQNAKRNFADVKNNDQALRRAFIPGLGNGLLGQNRDEALKRLQPALQDNAKRGLEQEDRAYLASQYVTPTEIETLYNPLTKQLEKEISSLPKGLFPAQKKTTWKGLTRAKALKSPFVSYEEALEKDPQAIQIMNSRLADFFLKNVKDDSSLLGIREKIWEDRDYDWRQFGPAIRQAQEKGLKLNPRQEREMKTVETQPPIQSLPDIFKDLSRILPFLRGAR